MVMAKMGLNIAGRIKNFNMAPQQSFLAVLEAVVNSIHSIIYRRDKEESFTSGWIRINVKREDTLIDDAKGDILAFEITDNGVGFIEDNMESFLTADSNFKEAIGGKGIGRFSWLKVFSEVKVESIYKDYSLNEEVNKRSFVFSLQNNSDYGLEIDDRLEAYTSKFEDNQTTVKLVTPLQAYNQGLKLSPEIMTSKIIEHCIEYLLEYPDIKIDLIYDETISINERFKEAIINQKGDIFDVSNESFTIRHLFISKNLLKDNYIYWSGNKRIVTKVKLDKYIANTKGAIFKDSTAHYVAVISGNFLDESVGDNRAVFNLPNSEDNNDNLFPDSITLKDIAENAKNVIKEFLLSEIKLIQEKSETRVKNFIKSKAPEYNHLLKYCIDDIRQLSANISEDRLESILHDLSEKHSKRIINELKEIERNTNLSTEEYQESFKKTVEKISESNKAKLIEYVSHRKVILELFEDGLKKEDDKYRNEAYIHNLIYPMKGSSDIVEEPLHNLWLIDERLAFCEYISSDLAIEKQGSRPDLLFLDNSVALSDEDSLSIYNTISIVELKRPMRTGYDEKDNPMTQMIKYVRKLKEGKCKSHDGRPIKVNANTQFYLYAVCDVDDSLKDILENSDYKMTADGEGYYKYHDNLKAQVEVIPFDRVLRNAKQRNKMFFKKLGI